VIVIKGSCEKCGAGFDRRIGRQDSFPFVTDRFMCGCGHCRFSIITTRGHEPVVLQVEGNVQPVAA
jgi:hypothetical protein